MQVSTFPRAGGRLGVGLEGWVETHERKLIQIMSIYNNNNQRTALQTSSYNEQTPKRGQQTRNMTDRPQPAQQTAAKIPSSTAETKKFSKSPNRATQNPAEYQNPKRTKDDEEIQERLEQQNGKDSPRYKKNEAKEANRGKDRLKSKLACIIDTINEQDSVATVSYYEKKTQRSDSEESESIRSNDRSPAYRQSNTRQNRGTNKQPDRKRETNKKTNPDVEEQSQEDSEVLKPTVQEKAKPNNKYIFYGTVKEEKVIPLKKTKKQGDQQVANKPKYPQKDVIKEQIFEEQSQRPLATIDYDYEKGKKKADEHDHERLRNKLGFIFNMINEHDEVASVSYYSEKHSEQTQEENQPENRQNEREKKEVIFNQDHSPHESFKKDSPKSIKKNQQQDDGIDNSNYNTRQRSNQPNKQNKPSNLKMLSKEQEEANLLRSDQQPKKKETKDKQPDKGQKKPVEAMKQINRADDFEEIQDILEEIQLKQNKAKNQVSRSMQNSKKQPLGRYEKSKKQLPSESKKMATSADKALSNDKLLKSTKPQKQKPITDKEKQKDKEKLTSEIQKSKSKAKLKQIQKQTKGDRYDMPEPKMSGSKSNDSKFSIKLHQVDIKQKSRSSKEAPIKEDPTINDNAKTVKKHSNQSKNSFEKLPQDTPAQQNSHKTVELPRKKSSYLQGDISGILLEESVKKKPNLKGNPFKDPITPNRIATIDYNDQSQSSQMSNFIVPKSKVEFRVQARRNMKTELSQKDDFHVLTEDEKKFLSLLKKREENMQKRVKEQFFSNKAKLFPSEPSSKNKESDNLRSNDVLDNIMDETRFPTQQTSQFNKGEQKSKMSMYEQDGTRPDELKDKPYFPTLTLSPRKDQSVSYYDAQDRRRINDSKKVNYLNAHKRIVSDHASSDSSRLYSMGTEQFEEVRNPKKQTPSKLQFYNASKLHKDYSQRIKHNTNAKEKYERLKALLEQI